MCCLRCLGTCAKTKIIRALTSSIHSVCIATVLAIVSLLHPPKCYQLWYLVVVTLAR